MDVTLGRCVVLLIVTGLLLAQYYLSFYLFPTNKFKYLLSPNRILNSNTSSNKNSRVVNEKRLRNNSLEVPLEKCVPIKVKLSNVSLPVTALASYPGSGNTWTRHLIQQMTGIGTSSVYCDKKLRGHGFPFECNRDRGQTIAVKTHRRDLSNYQKAVLLIRRPEDALLAFFHFKKAGHLGYAKTSRLNSSAWTNFVLGEMNEWLHFHTKWLVEFPGAIHVVHYEQLKINLFGELLELASFLGVNVTSHAIQCTVQLQNGNFHRKYEHNEREDLIKRLFSQDMVERLKNISSTVNIFIKDRFHKDHTMA